MFSGDEETYQKTAEDLVKNHKDFVDAEYALNSDGGGGRLDDKTGAPISYALQTAEKSYADFELTTRNPGGHSSQPRQDNAIYELADVLKRIQAYQFPVMYNDTTIGCFKIAGQETGPLRTRAPFHEHPGDAAAEPCAALQLCRHDAHDLRRDLLRGGHAQNALPQSATVTSIAASSPGSHQTISDTLQRSQETRRRSRRWAIPSRAPSPLRKDIVDAVTRAVRAASGATDHPDPVIRRERCDLVQSVRHPHLRRR